MTEVDRICGQVRTRAPNAARHLERAAESVLFNIGEGVAAFRPKVKIAAYEIAKREASEVRAVVRRLVIKRVLRQSQADAAYEKAGEVIGMLTNAIIAAEKRDRGER